MAKCKCISAVVEVEHRVALMGCFLRAIEDVSGGDVPDWVVVQRELLSGLEGALELVSVEVRK